MTLAYTPTKGFGTTLRYDYEVRDEKQFFKGISTPRISKDMIELAGHILDRKAGHFDPDKFRDEYERALRKLVKRKAAGHTIEATAAPEPASNVVNIMDALRDSLKRKKTTSASNRKKSRRSRPSKRLRKAS